MVWGERWRNQLIVAFLFNRETVERIRRVGNSGRLYVPSYYMSTVSKSTTIPARVHVHPVEDVSVRKHCAMDDYVCAVDRW